MTLNAERKAGRFPSAASTAEWKQAAGWAAIRAKADKARLDAVSFDFQPIYAKGPLPDTGGIHPTEKAIVDALVEVGMIPDDNRWHNAGQMSRRPIMGVETGVMVTVYPAEVEPHSCTCRESRERSQRANQIKAARRR